MALNKILQIGEMPKACYLGKRANTQVEGQMINWMGVRAYGLDKKLGDYLWWDNFEGDINNENEREVAVRFLSSLYFKNNVQGVIGSAINIRKSVGAKRVKLLNEANVYGMYIEAEKRAGFNFRMNIDGFEPRISVEQDDRISERYALVCEQIKAVMPYRK